MVNIMFGRGTRFGKIRFAGTVRQIAGVHIEYPFIDNCFTVEFYSRDGIKTAVLTSLQKDFPVISLEFELAQTGCAGFSLTLAKTHGVDIFYGQRVDISLFGDKKPWYSGYIQTKPVEGTTEDVYKYSGYGFYSQLEHVIVNREYFNREISDIAADIVREDIDRYTGAHYNESKIYTTDYRASQLAFDYCTAKEALKQLSEFAVNFLYGVDEYRDVFFRPMVTRINEDSRLWVGYHIQKFIPEEDVETVVNYVYVQGGALDDEGSNIMYQCSDADSIAAYGKRAAVLSIPSAVKEEDAGRWGDNQLDRLKDPQKTAKVDVIAKEIARRNIRPEGMARITTADGSFSYDYPIQTVKYKVSGKGVIMTMELGEYTKDYDSYMLKLLRDVKNEELLSRANTKAIVTGDES